MRAQIGLAWGAALVVVAGSFISVSAILRRRKNPREKERRRRELVNQQGRVIEGYANAVADSHVEYGYHWRGVRYEASQDISDFIDAGVMVDDFTGPVTVKFLGSRPANSIVVAETWSGIPSVVNRTGRGR